MADNPSVGIPHHLLYRLFQYVKKRFTCFYLTSRQVSVYNPTLDSVRFILSTDSEILGKVQDLNLRQPPYMDVPCALTN